MIDAVHAIALVIAFLALGVFLARFISENLRKASLGLLMPVVYLMLFSIGFNEASFLVYSGMAGDVFRQAAIMAAALSLLNVIVFALAGGRSTSSGSHKPKSGLTALMGCVKAFASLLIGIAVYCYVPAGLQAYILPVDGLLYALLFLIGIDLAGVKLPAFSFRLISCPLLVIAANIGAAGLYACLSELSLREALLVVSGFGWFTLSGSMVGSLTNPYLGSMAFMVDFFREMVSIVFLCYFGKTRPMTGIALCGAAALDSALPFIRDNCDKSLINYALVSGFVLTLLAPVLIGLLASTL